MFSLSVNKRLCERAVVPSTRRVHCSADNRSLPPHDFDTSKENTDNGMKKCFDPKIQQSFDVTNEDVKNESGRNRRNVPW
jgi:hypothetical protein